MIVIKKYAITVAGLLLINLFSFGQTKLPSVVVNDIDKSTAFEELIELLADSDYFIQTMDKDVGFIQAKYKVEEKKGIFNSTTGSRIIYNLFLKQLDNDKLRITLQANVEKEIWNRNANDRQYHYRDEGISQDSEHYAVLLDLIESHFKNQ